MYKEGEGIVARAHGPLPGCRQDVPADESMAFLVYLLHFGVGAAAFITDCKFVLDTFEKGRLVATSGWFVYGAIW